MSRDRNCFPYDICIDRAKNELKELVESPNTQLVNEYTALVQKEYAAMEQFVYNNRIPHEDVGELFDAMRAKYGIDPAVDLNSYVSDKMHIIVEAGRGLNTCPCCKGAKTHMLVQKNSDDSIDKTYDCETCRGTGKLA